jgi:hypothetical protein
LKVYEENGNGKREKTLVDMNIWEGEKGAGK